jgi:hypothetical protein
MVNGHEVACLLQDLGRSYSRVVIDVIIHGAAIAYINWHLT